MHSLINGGVGNNPTNPNLTYGQGFSGKCEALEVYTGIKGVQRVSPLIRNTNSKGILGKSENVEVQELINGGTGSKPKPAMAGVFW